MKSISLCLLIGLLVTVACSDSPSSSNEQPPKVPPARSMDADFTIFNQQKSGQNTVQATNNFGRAVTTAIVMKAVADINLAIPRALLAAARNANATLNQDGKWEWNYSKTAESNTYGVQLVASRQNNAIEWNFYVTNSQAALQDQLFFSGTSNADGTQGTWTYYNLKNTDTQEKTSQITWDVTGNDNVELKLEVVSGQNAHAGDYLKYVFDGSVKHAEYYNAAKDETTTVQWNVNTKAGFIIAPGYNGGQRSCWDADFQDVACAEK